MFINFLLSSKKNHCFVILNFIILFLAGRCTRHTCATHFDRLVKILVFNVRTENLDGFFERAMQKNHQFWTIINVRCYWANSRKHLNTFFVYTKILNNIRSTHWTLMIRSGKSIFLVKLEPATFPSMLWLCVAVL